MKQELKKITKNVYAYLQIPGTWGYNNAGFIFSEGQSLLIDTLFDLNFTEKLKIAIEKQFPELNRIDYVLNTHSNPDHFYGNQVFKDAKIISTKISKDEMLKILPNKMNLLTKFSFLFGATGKYIKDVFKNFNFMNLTSVLPSETFSGEKELTIGSIKIKLIEILNTHTASDVIVIIPGEKVVFMSDLLFIETTPLIWNTSIKNWLNALDMVLDMDVEYIIPGHGNITNKDGIIKMKRYIQFCEDETKKKFGKNKSILEIAKEINLGEYKNIPDSERAITFIHAKYSELKNDFKPYNSLLLFKLMAKYKKCIC